MPNRNYVLRLGTLGLLLTLTSFLAPQAARACAGTIPATPCAKTVVSTKAVTVTIIAGVPTPTIPVTVFCTSGPSPGAVCPVPPAPVEATTTVDIFAPPFFVPPPVASGMVVTLPPALACAPAPGGAITLVMVPTALVPPTTFLVPGAHLVTGSTDILFDDGLTVTGFGDQMVCVVEEVPESGGTPRLDMVLLTDPFEFVAPGEQAEPTYLITNNDPSERVTLTLTATSKQASLTPDVSPLPAGASPEDVGVFALSNHGDDFVIAFDPGGSCIPLPDHPYIQIPLTMTLELEPGESAEVAMGVRPWGQCSSGSCSETTLVAEGSFLGGDPVVVCGGASVFVDTSLPPLGCALETDFDCNENGEYDADDIALGVSADDNNNAIPDECETPVVPTMQFWGTALLILLMSGSVALLTIMRNRRILNISTHHVD